MHGLTGLPASLQSWTVTYPHNTQETEPVAVNPGDLWVLSWDGAYLGSVCLAAVNQSEGFVLGWPVTWPGEPAFAPALVVQSLHLWPTRETGLGMHLLHQCLGRLIDPNRIQQVAWAMEDGEDPGLPFASGSAQDAANEAADEAFVEAWASLCFHTWPDRAPTYLSEPGIKAAGGNAARAARCLGLAPVQLRPIWTGVSPLSSRQVDALADDLGVEPGRLIGDDPLLPAMNRLAHPRFKGDLLDAASRARISEGESRDRTRAEYALAARDDTTAVSDARLTDAIKRVARSGR